MQGFEERRTSFIFLMTSELFCFFHFCQEEIFVRTGPHVFHGALSTFLATVVFVDAQILFVHLFFKVQATITMGQVVEVKFPPDYDAARLRGSLPRPRVHPGPALHCGAFHLLLLLPGQPTVNL